MHLLILITAKLLLQVVLLHISNTSNYLHLCIRRTSEDPTMVPKHAMFESSIAVSITIEMRKGSGMEIGKIYSKYSNLLDLNVGEIFS